jgi:hypothetical protein
MLNVESSRSATGTPRLHAHAGTPYDLYRSFLYFFQTKIVSHISYERNLRC